MAATNERRRLARKIADEVIEVYDLVTETHVGRVVNLHQYGLMLVSPEPVASGLVLQMELVLDSPGQPSRRFGFGAESLWCSEANRPHHYWTGFRIIDISLEAQEVIESIISDWGGDDLVDLRDGQCRNLTQ